MRIAIRLAGRRDVAGTVIGILRAAMDEELGIPIAELQLARAGHDVQRLVVRTGEILGCGPSTLRVQEIHPYNGRTPAGVVLEILTDSAEVSAELG